MNFAIKSSGGTIGHLKSLDRGVILFLSTKDSPVIFETIKQYMEDLGFTLIDNSTHGGRGENGKRVVSTSQISRHYAKPLVSEKKEVLDEN